jgi:hypothetical protein
VVATVVQHPGDVAGERGVHIADVPILDLLNRERHPVRPLQRVAELAVPGIVPRHVVPEDLEEAFHVARLVEHDLKRQLLLEFVQLLRLQLDPHVRVAIIRPSHSSVNRSYVGSLIRAKLVRRRAGYTYCCVTA